MQPVFLATTMILTSGPWVIGYPVDLSITGAPGLTRVYVKRTSNLSGPGACPASMAPTCLDIAAPTRSVGSDVATIGGLAELSPVVPATITAAQIEVQAHTNGAAAEVSNVLLVDVHQAASDADGDGLVAGDEVGLWGTDPADADSDDGGVADGDEVYAGTSPTDPTDDPPTYASDVYPMFAVECSGCHTGVGLSGGFNLDDYADVVDAPSIDVPAMDRIEPFDLANSYLHHKLSGTQATVGGSGVQMPRNGPPYLDALQMQLVEDWVNTGALP